MTPDDVVDYWAFTWPEAYASPIVRARLRALAIEYLAEAPLNRPLKFGDAEQIALLRKWADRIPWALEKWRAEKRKG